MSASIANSVSGINAPNVSGRILGAILVAAVAVMLMSCGRTDVRLKSDEPNLIPGPGPQKPGPETGNPGQPQPIPGTLEVSYRVFCQFPDPAGSLLTMTSSIAKPWDVSPEIAMSVSGVSPSYLKYFKGLVPLLTENGLNSQIMFQARMSANGTGFSSNSLWLSDVNLATGKGQGTQVGTFLPSVDSAAANLAENLGVELRSYGASSAGAFLIVPSSPDRMKVLNRRDLSLVAEINLDSTRTFLPFIDEGRAVFTAYQFTGVGFKNLVIPFKNAGGVLTFDAPASIPAAKQGWTQMPVFGFGQLNYAWAEVSLASLGSQIDIVRFDGVGFQRSSFIPQAGALVLPWVASHLSGSQLSVGVLVEDIKASVSGTSILKAKVNDAKISFLSVDLPVATVSSEIKYPADVVNSIELNGRLALNGRFGASGLLASLDLKAAFAVLPRQTSASVYQIGQTEWAALGQGACLNPAVLREEF